MVSSSTVHQLSQASTLWKHPGYQTPLAAQGALLLGFLNSTVVGNWCNESNPVRTVQPDSQSVVGAEAPGRLHLTILPPVHPLYTPCALPVHPLCTPSPLCALPIKAVGKGFCALASALASAVSKVKRLSLQVANCDPWTVNCSPWAVS
eukprot:8293615-Pyramimonas_sp.AAC.2